eukprot:TRINITY_DN70816_c0_g1_i1.p1 TRINITY_DN70816_c0_g1~~TRINITY_DN70816_c0_g1_i1.p1  ORF type:complete len:646 (+),score=154.87 TRINITY_DN70816_c0_g1_i1:95-1939(+)
MATRGSYLTRLAAHVAGLEEAVGVQSRARQKAEGELAATKNEYERRSVNLQGQVEAAQLEARAARKAVADRWRLERERDRLAAELAEAEEARDSALEAAREAEGELEAMREKAQRAADTAVHWEEEARRLGTQVAELGAERAQLVSSQAELQQQLTAMGHALAVGQWRATCDQLRKGAADAAAALGDADRERLYTLIGEVEELDKQAAQALWRVLAARVSGRKGRTAPKDDLPVPESAPLAAEWQDPGTHNTLRLAVAKPNAGLTYTVNGEARPVVREITHNCVLNALEFPGIGRGCTLPAAEDERCRLLGRIRVLCSLGGAEHNIGEEFNEVGSGVLCYVGLRTRTRCGECGRGPYYLPLRRCTDCGSALYYGTWSSSQLWAALVAHWARRRRELVGRRRVAAACAAHAIQTAADRRPSRPHTPQQSQASSPRASTVDGAHPVRAPRVVISAADHFEECRQRAEARERVMSRKPWWERGGGGARQAWQEEGEAGGASPAAPGRLPSPSDASPQRGSALDAPPPRVPEPPSHGPQRARARPLPMTAAERHRRRAKLRRAPPSKDRERRHDLRPLKSPNELPANGKWDPVSKPTGRDSVATLAAWLQYQACPACT